jgi:hypothetical protein
MLRATHDRASSRQKKLPPAVLDLNKKNLSNTAEYEPSPTKKARLSHGHSRSDSLSTVTTGLQLSGGQQGDVFGSPRSERNSAGGGNHQPRGPTPEYNLLGDDLLDEDFLGDNSPSGNQPAATLDEIQRMKLEMNPNDPFDLDTAYGKYITIHTVVKKFNDEFQIQRLTVHPGAPKDALVEASTVAALEEETQLWKQELEALAKKERFVLCVATDEEVAKQSQLQKYFDNPKFQRFDYVKACKALGIQDPKRPRFDGMPTTLTFRTWQVVGIHALVEFKVDPTIRAAILADATGLGKTMQIIGYWYYVSSIIL